MPNDSSPVRHSPCRTPMEAVLGVAGREVHEPPTDRRLNWARCGLRRQVDCQLSIALS
jgi:hypothetical protein